MFSSLEDKYTHKDKEWEKRGKKPSYVTYMKNRMKIWETDGVLQSKVEENAGHLSYWKNI